MILRADRIAARLDRAEGTQSDPLIITPPPDIESVRKSGAASVDLRLGTWFVTPRARKVTSLEVSDGKPDEHEERLTKTIFVPFGSYFVLHPRSFVLAATLEWIRLPNDLTGYVTGKSSWGRRGLIIETAMGVHPTFSGCLTLELANVGEVPIRIHPGMLICQLFLHETHGEPGTAEGSSFVGYGRPVLGQIGSDAVAAKLSQALR